MHHLLPLFISSFLSLIPLDSFVYSWQKGGEYTGVYRYFYMTYVHILRGRNSTSCSFIRRESHWGNAYTKGEKTSFMRKYCFFCFILCLFSRCFMVLCVIFSILCFVALIASCLCVGHAFILMLLCFIGCMFEWSFALLYDHCDHFHMTILCLIKLLICFTTCLLDRMFTCYIILVLLSLELPWGSNAFCASVSGYRYTCSKTIIASRFRCEWVFPLFPNSRLSLESVIGYFIMK